MSNNIPCAHHKKVMECKRDFIAKWGMSVLIADATAVRDLIESRKQAKASP